MIHDIGKLRIPEAIVNKPGRLTDDEFELMKQHAAEGGEMVECLGDPALAAAVRSHHERWDGSGYPDGLSGERIPLEARIISVVDTFDAIASERSYRAATPHAKVLRIIDEEAGRQLDPDAARAFISCYSDRRGAAMWAAIASVPRQVAERLSIRPGEIAGLLGAAVTASLVVVAGAMAADALPVTSDPPQPAISRAAVTAEPAETPSAQTASPSPSTPPAAGTETPPAAGADAPPGGARAVCRRRAQAVSSPRATSPARRPRPQHHPAAMSTASAPSEPPPAQPAAALPHRPRSCQRSRRKARCRRRSPTPQPNAEPTPQPLPTPTPEPTAEPSPPPTADADAGAHRAGADPRAVAAVLATTLPVFPASTPTPPTHSKDDCKNGGWMDLGYLNQGQCIADAERRSVLAGAGPASSSHSSGPCTTKDPAHRLAAVVGNQCVALTRAARR